MPLRTMTPLPLRRPLRVLRLLPLLPGERPLRQLRQQGRLQPRRLRRVTTETNGAARQQQRHRRGVRQPPLLLGERPQQQLLLGDRPLRQRQPVLMTMTTDGRAPMKGCWSKCAE